MEDAMDDIPATAAGATAAESGGPDISGAAALTQLCAFIEERGFAPGDRLPAERRLGPELGLRRSELRKALEALVRDGVLWRHVGKGTFLAINPDQPAGDNLAALARRVSPADAMRARAAFEPGLAREAALHATAAAIGQIRVITDRSRRAASWREYEALDNDFHRSIAAASASITLVALFDQLNLLRRMIAWGRITRTGPAPPPGHPSFAEHDAIVDAIEGRDPEAAQAAMRLHLKSVAERLGP
jgi:DNA-binding FadR family transcriptional regulator